MSPYLPKNDDEARRLNEAYHSGQSVQCEGWPLPCKVTGMTRGLLPRYLLEVVRPTPPSLAH